MSPSFEQRAEQALLQAVRTRRQRRRLYRSVAAISLITFVAVLLGLTQRHRHSASTVTPDSPLAASTGTESPAKHYQQIASRSDAFTPITSSTQMPLVVVHTGGLPLPIAIDDRELFAYLPNAVIKIDKNKEEEVIWPQ